MPDGEEIRLAQQLSKLGLTPPLTGYEARHSTLVHLWATFNQLYAKAWIGKTWIKLLIGPDHRIHLTFDDVKLDFLAFTGCMIPVAYWLDPLFPMQWTNGRVTPRPLAKLISQPEDTRQLMFQAHGPGVNHNCLPSMESVKLENVTTRLQHEKRQTATMVQNQAELKHTYRLLPEQQQKIIQDHAAHLGVGDFLKQTLAPPQVCFACQVATKKRCSRCKTIYICSIACQRLIWPQHKQICHTSVSSTPPVLGVEKK